MQTSDVSHLVEDLKEVLEKDDMDSTDKENRWLVRKKKRPEIVKSPKKVNSRRLLYQVM